MITGTCAGMAHLPALVSKRPRLGSRRLAQGALDQCLPAVCADLRCCWQEGMRGKAARLLHVLLAYCEGAVDQHITHLLPAVSQAGCPASFAAPLAYSVAEY